MKKGSLLVGLVTLSCCVSVAGIFGMVDQVMHGAGTHGLIVGALLGAGVGIIAAAIAVAIWNDPA